jgi:hypothetical protein
MSNLATLSTLKGLIGAGARPNLFAVDLPTIGTSVLCKATSLPGSSIGIIEVPMSGGRRYKLGGDRTFAEWSVTLILDPLYNTRRLLEALQDSSARINYESTTTFQSKASLGNITVTQLGSTAGVNSITRKYTLYNTFISDISAIDLSYDSTDAISEYTVTWVYDYFTAS